MEALRCDKCDRLFDADDLFLCDCGYALCEDCAERLVECDKVEDGVSISALCPKCGAEIGIDLHLKFWEF